MTLTGEVIAKVTSGDEVAVTIGNVRSTQSATWRMYAPKIVIEVPLCRERSYYIGRKVTIDIHI